MSSPVPQRGSCRAGRCMQGSILLYVLWILVVISALAFQLTSASRATTLNQSAFANRLQQQMQVESAIQFAVFKILAGQWQDRTFSFDLNGEEFEISVFNEAGFVSLYDPGSRLRQDIFESLGLAAETISELDRAIKDEDRPQRFNSFAELRQFAGIDDALLQRLVLLVSIFHEESVSPIFSPVEVLMQFHRIDQYRVQQLQETADAEDKAQLRAELIESLQQQDLDLSDGLSPYFRVRVVIDGMTRWVFIKRDRRKAEFSVVLIENGGATAVADASLQ